MDLAIRIESYKNFAIMPPEKSRLPASPLIRITVVEKVVSEAYKVIGTKREINDRYRKIYMWN